MKHRGKSKILALLFILLGFHWHASLLVANFAHDAGITYGSIVRLRHVNTKQYLATGNETYDHQKSSRQPATYAIGNANDERTLWIIKGPHNPHRWYAHIGQVVKQGDVVRLENLKTGRNLHSHHLGLRSPATGQGECTSLGNNGVADANDNWIVDAVWEGTRGVLANGIVCRFIHQSTKLSLHSHGGHFFRRDAGLQEVTTYWNRDSNDWFSVELVSTPVEHNNHGLKDLWQSHRGAPLNYNTLIWIDPASTGWDRHEHGAGWWVELNSNGRRLWTHAASPFANPNAQEPHKHLEILCGPWDDRRCHGHGSWFFIQDAKDPAKTGPIKYGDQIKIFSTFGGLGWAQFGGILNPPKQWWMHQHHHWGAHHPSPVVSLPTHGDVNHSNGGQNGLFAFEPTLRGLKNGDVVHQADLLQIRSFGSKQNSKSRVLWLHWWSRWSNRYYEILANGGDDDWGMKTGGYRNFRDRIWHRFRVHHVRRASIPDWAKGDFDKVAGILNEKLGAEAAKAKAAFEEAKRVQAEADKKKAEELAKAAQAQLEQAKKLAADEAKKAKEDAEKALADLKKQLEAEKEAAAKLAKEALDKTKAEQQRKLDEALALQEELQRLADLPIGFTAKPGMLAQVSIGLQVVEKEGKKLPEIKAWGITKDSKLVEMVNAAEPWVLHAAKDDNGKELSAFRSVSIGSDGTTYAVTKEGKIYRYNWPNGEKSRMPRLKGNAGQKNEQGSAKKAKKKKKKKSKKKKKKKSKKKKKKKSKKKKN